MLTLAQGAYLNLVFGGASSELRRVEAPGRVRVTAAHRDLLCQLILGADERLLQHPEIARLQRHGMVARADSADDPVIERQLDAIAERWSWLQPQGRRAARLLAATRRAHARRKVFVRQFGQTACMPETAVRRALLAGPGKLRVLCIGDDDLLSIPLAMLGHQVTVYDVDDVILIPFLKAIAKEWRLPIRAVHRDLMAPQPARAGARFDLLYTDPMSTRECFDLFLSRGLSWLKPSGRAFCCVHAMAQETFDEVRRDMGFTVRARHHDFSHYYEEGFRENYYRSDMMELEPTRAFTPVYPLAQEARLDILSGELTNRQHFCCDILSVDAKRITRAHVEQAIRRIKRSQLIRVVGERRYVEERVYSYVAALQGGGYMGLSAYFDDHLVSYDLYPYQPARDMAIREALREEIPQTLTLWMHKVAKTNE